MVGKRIKSLRQDNGLSQAELAAALNVSRITINNYENDGRFPDIGFAMRCADYFGIATEYLIGRTEFRSQDDFGISTEKVGKLIEVIERLPQKNSQKLLEHLSLVLQRVANFNTAKETVCFIDGCCIQMDKMLCEYGRLLSDIIQLSY